MIISSSSSGGSINMSCLAAKAFSLTPYFHVPSSFSVTFFLACCSHHDLHLPPARGGGGGGSYFTLQTFCGILCLFSPKTCTYHILFLLIYSVISYFVKIHLL
jgi:hypothetical protein